MAGAQGAGDVVARAEASFAAGCDVVLACNDFAGIGELLERLRREPNRHLARRWAAMQTRR
jgi:beta-N-acetylhexosaminidase